MQNARNVSPSYQSKLGLKDENRIDVRNFYVFMS